METILKETLLMAIKMVKESISTTMSRDMKEIGWTMKRMVMENTFIAMEIDMRDIM